MPSSFLKPEMRRTCAVGVRRQHVEHGADRGQAGAAGDDQCLSRNCSTASLAVGAAEEVSPASFKDHVGDLPTERMNSSHPSPWWTRRWGLADRGDGELHELAGRLSVATRKVHSWRLSSSRSGFHRPEAELNRIISFPPSYCWARPALISFTAALTLLTVAKWR